MLRSSVSAKFAKDAPRLAIGPVRVTPEYVDDPAMGVDDPARDAQETAEGKKSFFQKYWCALVLGVVCFSACTGFHRMSALDRDKRRKAPPPQVHNSPDAPRERPQRGKWRGGEFGLELYCVNEF